MKMRDDGSFTRDIQCKGCRYSGTVRARDTEGICPETELFTLLGKTTDGFLRFKCPRCHAEFILDPYDAISAEMVAKFESMATAIPPFPTLGLRRVRRNRLLVGALAVGFGATAVFLVFHFHGWLGWLLGSISLLLGLAIFGLLFVTQPRRSDW